MVIPIIVGIVVTILIIDIAMRFYFGRKAMDLLDRMPPFRVEPTTPQKEATIFKAKTPVGITLEGSIFHPGETNPKGVIVFCPETLANHWSATNYCQALLDSGFIVVSFDFRNQGNSESVPGYEPLHWVTEYEVQDLLTVINWVEDQAQLAGLPIGLFGVSRGGSTALLAASQSSAATHLWIDSGYTNELLIRHYVHRWAEIIVPGWVLKISPSMWHITATLRAAFWFQQYRKNCRYIHSSDPVREMVGKRVFLVSGARDGYVPTGISEQIKVMLEQQCDELWVVPNAVHNGARNKHEAEYDRRLVQFFSQMSTQDSSVTATLEQIAQEIETLEPVASESE